ncbi:hypothetical protein EBQ91_00200 [bacterium]|nr:hypothetical protein [bacterium]
MALTKQVDDSVNEAIAALRNGLAFSSRGEHPIIIQALAEVLLKLDAIKSIEHFIAKASDSSRCGPY